MMVVLYVVFDLLIDKIIYDVFYQFYVYKMLIGWVQVFLDLVYYYDVFGYINFKESDDDFFLIGYILMFLVLVSGFIKVCDVLGNYENIVVVIGDGFFFGGLVYEGLNNVVIENFNVIVIVNDND